MVGVMTTPAIQIKEIAFIGYPSTNIAASRHFYETLLGLKETMCFAGDGCTWIEYDIGPTTLAISDMAPDKWKPSADGPSVVLEVVDFEAAVAALKAAKVPFFLEPMQSPACRLAIVQDPSGNSVGIHRRNS